MTDLEAVEQKALIVLFFESKIRPGKYFPITSTMREYHVKASEDLLRASFEPWFRLGWAKRYHQGAKTFAKLKPQAFGDAYKQVLSYLGGSTLSVYPDVREILSDAPAANEIPMREGWKWFKFDGTEPAPQFVATENLPSYRQSSVDWTKWGTIIGALGILVTILIAVLS